MNRPVERYADYFRASHHYFWQWADEGNVIAFANDRTVCYRDDLTFLLTQLSLDGKPPLGSILLLLCACKDNYNTLFELETQLYKLGYDKDYNDRQHETAKLLIGQTISLLRLINDLPFEERSGMKRVNLLQVILQAGSKKDDNENILPALVKAFETGQYDESVFKVKFDLYFETLKQDLTPLANALQTFGNTEALLTALKTGLTGVPQKLDIDLPPPTQLDLLEELSRDIKTSGIAQLARHIMAALHIPMHLSGSSDQSLGGVSDISNRGHFDKLLLSELAQDDVVLTARLANNEALFLQREQLPADHTQEWHVLIDTTLLMWGTPRVFAVAVGLAFSESKKTGKMRVWGLGNNEAEPLELDHKEGVIHALQRTDIGLNCAATLRRTIAAQTNKKDKFILITALPERPDPVMMMALDAVSDRLDHKVEVDRHGHIALYEAKGKRRRMIAKAVIDLNEVLFGHRSIKRKAFVSTAGLPAFMAAGLTRLRYPASKIKIKNDNVLKIPGDQIILVTLDKRVMLWTDSEHGGIELVDHLAGNGNYHWGHGEGDSNGLVFLMVIDHSKGLAMVHEIDPKQAIYSSHAVDEMKGPISDVWYGNNNFYVRNWQQVTMIDPHSGGMSQAPGDANGKGVVPYYRTLTHVKKMINNGYSVINSAKHVFIHTAGRIFVDNRELRPDPHGRFLQWKENAMAAVAWVKPETVEPMTVEHLPNIKFTKYIWQNGSEMVLDSRGLLHLKSANTNIPEATIVMVIDKTTAAWSADGKVCGSSYFIGESQQDVMLAADFYDVYINSFIQALR